MLFYFLGLGGFLRQRAHTLLHSPWEVVEVLQTSTPGQFKIFALIGSELHTMKVGVVVLLVAYALTTRRPSDWKRVAVDCCTKLR